MLANTLHLIQNDIIEKVDGPTTWLNPAAPTIKPTSDKSHVHLDTCCANEAMVRECHVIPKIVDILTELEQAKVLFKIHLREGYN